MPATIVLEQRSIHPIRNCRALRLLSRRIGSPTCTLFGLASVAMVKLPLSLKLGGAFGGRGFTSTPTGSLLIWMSRDVHRAVQMGSRKTDPKTDRRDRIDRKANANVARFAFAEQLNPRAFALTGPISNFPARAAAMAVLNVTHTS